MAEKKHPPTAFISYAWDDAAHQKWVKELASHLRSDGVSTTLDQWHLQPSDKIPEFMESAVRDHDFVVIICTPKYKERSDSRTGGVGYEGDIFTAEMALQKNHKKYIPVSRFDEWVNAAPVWLLGSRYIDLSSDPYDKSEYELLLRKLHDELEKPLDVGPHPIFLTSKGFISGRITSAKGIITQTDELGELSGNKNHTPNLKKAPTPDEILLSIKEEIDYRIGLLPFLDTSVKLLANSPTPNNELNRIFARISNKDGGMGACKNFWGTRTHQYLDALNKYNYFLSRGRTLVAGESGTGKTVGLKYYEDAFKISDDLFKDPNLPRFLTGHLKAQAISHRGSMLYYESDFDGSINDYDIAQEIYERDDVREGYEHDILNDKEIAVKAFKLSAFLPSAQRNRREPGYISDYYLEKFDDTTTRFLIEKVLKDENTPNNLCDSILKFIEVQLNDEQLKIDLSGYFDSEIKRADRRTIMHNRSIYLANRAYADLYLSWALNDKDAAKSAADNLLMAMNYNIDGAATVPFKNRDYNPAMIGMYLDHPDVVDPAILNSLGRNLCYRYMACQLAGMDQEREETENILIAIAIKEKKNVFILKNSSVLRTMETAKRNLDVVGLSDAWIKFKMDDLINKVKQIYDK